MASAKSSYRVVIPLVITKKPDGSDLYVYQDGIIPATATQEEIDRLLAEKFIEAVSVDTAVALEATSESN